MQKRTVVSFADGVGHYIKAMARLELSLKEVGFQGNFKGINDYGHIQCPHHKGAEGAVPYAFKAYSIQKAIEEGAETILWCDSVVYATKSVDPIFEYIEKNGYLFFDNIGFSIGDYTSDACLNNFGMSREEAFNSKMIMACVMGFNIHHPEAKLFLEKYIAAAKDGISYLGDWQNDELQVSRDMRVKGHRHDQSVASILVKKYGLKIIKAQDSFFAYSSHKGYVNISESVGLWSEGI